MVSGIPFAAAAAVIATSVHVFFQSSTLDGGIREALIDIGTGQVSGGTSFDVVFEAKLQSPIAAMETTDVCDMSTSCWFER